MPKKNHASVTKELACSRKQRACQNGNQKAAKERSKSRLRPNVNRGKPDPPQRCFILLQLQKNGADMGPDRSCCRSLFV